MNITGERVVITGDLRLMKREDAVRLLEIVEGIYQPTVTKETTILVIGQAKMSLFVEEQVSQKIQKVEKNVKQGQRIRKVTEYEFFDSIFQILQQRLGHLKA